MPEIETSRLSLCRLEEKDATETYAAWLNDPDVNKYLETRHTQQSAESCKEFIASCNSDPGSHLFGIFLKETGVHIGNAKIGFINKYYDRGQVSLFIGEKKYWNKGLSTEIVCALNKYAFLTLGLQRLEAGCYEDNLSSLRVFLKSGYVVEGFMRSHVARDGRRLGCFWLGMLASEYLE